MRIEKTDQQKCDLVNVFKSNLPSNQLSIASAVTVEIEIWM
jgi:hypothetical protein